ncbi:MAG: beta-N-acetylhexosaminidase [Burkholderiales bacterium]
MLDIAGLRPDAAERYLIGHPLVGGLILFSRNFESPEQLEALTVELHDSKPELLVAVDHEGGRVQRFRSGFTELPPMAALGCAFDANPAQALRQAQATGFVLAWELRRYGVDLSFTPVLDIDHKHSAVIGNRAFHRDPEAVALLAAALSAGLREAGFAAVGKHFPGHGFVGADSHHDLPVDTRSLQALEQCDMIPFQRLIADGLEGIMPAHILYPAIDAQPAGFSTFWLQHVLRGSLGFDGVIFSDDLSMKGALGAGTPAERAHAALAAGCDMVLLCNDSQAAQQLVTGLEGFHSPADSQRRLARLAPTPFASREVIEARYQVEQTILRTLQS